MTSSLAHTEPSSPNYQLNRLILGGCTTLAEVKATKTEEKDESEWEQVLFDTLDENCVCYSFGQRFVPGSAVL